MLSVWEWENEKMMERNKFSWTMHHIHIPPPRSIQKIQGDFLSKSSADSQYQTDQYNQRRERLPA